MIFSINLDIELTDEELKWLKDKFLPNRRTYNVILGEMKESSYKENPIVKNLSEKNMKNELDLDNPIFVVYLNVDGMNPTRAQDLIENYKKFLKYDNCTFWIVAVTDQKTKFDMIWKGQKYDTQSFDNVQTITQLNKRMSKLMELISEGTTDDVLKQKLRDFTLDQILENE